MLIEKIVIGDRVRKDMGDLVGLAESMKRHGLLHPVVVKKDSVLVAGHRRIEAARNLGWKDIPATVIDVTDLLSAERDENFERKNFTPSEAVAIGRLIEEQEKPLAEERHRTLSRRGPDGLGGLDSGPPKRMRKVVNIVSKAVGMGADKYKEAKAVIAAAEADPTRFGDLPAKMDETGNVHITHQELQRRQTGKGRNPALRKMSHLKPNREIERAVFSLDGICACLLAINVKELDAKQTSGWAKSLKKTASTLHRVARRLTNV